MHAYTSQDYKPDLQEQPPAPERSAELGGLAESSGPKQRTPQNMLAQGNPEYAVLASLEPNVAAELEKQLYKGQDGYYMGQPVNMLLQKFHFDRRVNCSDAARELRALVFDEICAASFKKERFSRMYH